MSGGREHSRSRPAASQGAAGGANQLRPDEVPAVDEPNAAADGTEQPFARAGQFTGRSMPPAEPESVSSDPLQDRLEEARLSGGQSSDEGGEVAVLRTQLAEANSHLQRMAADFDNFRKRAAREREAASAAADAKLLGELLVVLDDFERAMEVAHGDNASVEDVAAGVRMIDERLRSVLGSAGLSEVATDAGFDPHLHEALLVQPGSGQPEGAIIQVVQRGYQLGDRVIRHARVIVAGGDENG